MTYKIYNQPVVNMNRIWGAHVLTFVSHWLLADIPFDGRSSFGKNTKLTTSLLLIALEIVIFLRAREILSTHYTLD